MNEPLTYSAADVDNILANWLLKRLGPALLAAVVMIIGGNWYVYNATSEATRQAIDIQSDAITAQGEATARRLDSVQLAIQRLDDRLSEELRSLGDGQEEANQNFTDFREETRIEFTSVNEKLLNLFAIINDAGIIIIPSEPEPGMDGLFASLTESELNRLADESQDPFVAFGGMFRGQYDFAEVKEHFELLPAPDESGPVLYLLDGSTGVIRIWRGQPFKPADLGNSAMTLEDAIMNDLNSADLGPADMGELTFLPGFSATTVTGPDGQMRWRLSDPHSGRLHARRQGALPSLDPSIAKNSLGIPQEISGNVAIFGKTIVSAPSDVHSLASVNDCSTVIIDAALRISEAPASFCRSDTNFGVVIDIASPFSSQ